MSRRGGREDQGVCVRSSITRTIHLKFHQLKTGFIRIRVRRPCVSPFSLLPAASFGITRGAQVVLNRFEKNHGHWYLQRGTSAVREASAIPHRDSPK
jgi:hypothetical protein